VSSSLVVRSHQRTCRIHIRLVRQISQEALQRLFPQSESELGVHLVNRNEIIRLNQTFLRHQGSTDVITFDYRGRLEHAVLRAEIFICVDEAITQACQFRTRWQNELVRYLIHGLLHLAGYDDRRPTARRKMKRAENRLLKAIAGRFTLSQIGRESRKAETQRPKSGGRMTRRKVSALPYA